MNIKCVCDKKEYKTSYIGKGHLIPIGGGKDSVVSLELLKDYKDINNPFIINPKEVTLSCANVAGYDNDSMVTVKRVIDKNLIELNSEGFLKYKEMLIRLNLVLITPEEIDKIKK